jgi:hypothetical protein
LLYVKAALAGLLAACLACVLWILVAFVLPVALPFLLSRVIDDGGAGMAAAYITSDSILIAGLIGFIAGFAWNLRRVARRH